ncbi:phosphotransferase [Sorangium sp. So ce426]|uniref:phosphotransferase n=1 Tax=unclassified Sorangium TaxID=2621164 RepID=UPI003F5B7BB7
MTTVVRSLLSADEVARRVQEEYPLEGALRARLMAVGDNDTYLVETPSSRYVCRLYVTRPERARSAHLFELSWVRHLAERGVLVSAPLTCRDGSLLGTVDAPEGPRDLALFTWADGAEADWSRGDRLARYGQCIGEMHLATRGFETDHARPALGVELLVTRPMERIDAHLRSLGLSHELAWIEQLAKRVQRRLESLPQDHAYGVIHGDCNGENHHVLDDGRAVFFDMDLCGPGWFAYDLAVYLWILRRKGVPPAEAMARGSDLIAGYRRARELEAWELEALDDLVLARHLWVMGEHVADIPCLGALRVGPDYWRAGVEMLGGWLREPLAPAIIASSREKRAWTSAGERVVDARASRADDAARAFRSEGYVILDDVFSTAFVDELRHDFAALLEAKVARYGLVPAGRGEHVERNDGVLNHFRPEGGNHDINRWNMHLPSRRPFLNPELIDNAQITGVIDALMGPDWVYYLMASDTPYPDSGYQTAHQDFTRFSVAINIPLVDVTADNGPMEVWPGTHRLARDGGLAPFSTDPLALGAQALQSVVRENVPRRLLMQRGSVLIRDHRLVHRGTPNLTRTPRHTLSLYCVAPTAVPFRLLADLGAVAALKVRRLGRGHGAAVEHRRLFELGSVLGRTVEECSMSDRDYRRPIPEQLWSQLSPAAQRRLRFARVSGRSGLLGAGSLAGSRHLLVHWAEVVTDAAMRKADLPRVPDYYHEHRT